MTAQEQLARLNVAIQLADIIAACGIDTPAMTAVADAETFWSLVGHYLRPGKQYVPSAETRAETVRLLRQREEIRKRVMGANNMEWAFDVQTAEVMR